MSAPVWDDYRGDRGDRGDRANDANTDDRRPIEHPPLARDARVDAVVVGLGASGLTALDELHRRGLTAVGVDRGTVGCGAAGRNGGLLLAGLALFHHQAVLALGRDRAAAAYRATLAELDRSASRWPDLVRRSGSIRVAASDAEEPDCAMHLAALQADGFDARSYEGPEGVGLLIADDATIQPLSRCRRHADELAGERVGIHEHSPALVVAPNRVQTPAATIEAGHVIVCVDGGLEALLPSLTGRVRSTRLQMLATERAPDVDVPRPVYRRWGYDYWHQLPDRRLAVGGGRDLHEPLEWGAPAEPTQEVQGHLDSLLREVIGTAAPVTHRWAGTVSYTDDRLPVIETIAPGLVACGAYSGHGNLVGPLAARAAVELALDGRSPLAELLAGPTLGA